MSSAKICRGDDGGENAVAPSTNSSERASGDQPVAAALQRWAPEAGFRVGEPDGSDLYVVHTDHDAPDLVPALERLFARRPRFVGLMGSRRHTGGLLDEPTCRGDL